MRQSTIYSVIICLFKIQVRLRVVANGSEHFFSIVKRICLQTYFSINLVFEHLNNFSVNAQLFSNLITCCDVFLNKSQDYYIGHDLCI